MLIPIRSFCMFFLLRQGQTRSFCPDSSKPVLKNFCNGFPFRHSEGKGRISTVGEPFFCRHADVRFQGGNTLSCCSEQNIAHGFQSFGSAKGKTNSFSIQTTSSAIFKLSSPSWEARLSESLNCFFQSASPVLPEQSGVLHKALGRRPPPCSRFEAQAFPSHRLFPEKSMAHKCFSKSCYYNNLPYTGSYSTLCCSWKIKGSTNS